MEEIQEMNFEDRRFNYCLLKIGLLRMYYCKGRLDTVRVGVTTNFEGGRVGYRTLLRLPTELHP